MLWTDVSDTQDTCILEKPVTTRSYVLNIISLFINTTVQQSKSRVDIVSCEVVELHDAFPHSLLRGLFPAKLPNPDVYPILHGLLVTEGLSTASIPEAYLGSSSPRCKQQPYTSTA